MRHNEFTEMPKIATVMVEEKKLKGMKICITGHLGAPRKEIEEMIVTLGGQVNGNVTYDTTHLLTNQDWNDGAKSSKFIKAKGYGVKLITEAQFYELIGKSEF